MSANKVAPEPQKCPKCGAQAEVKNPKRRNWFVACSRNSGLVGGHYVVGHGMFTKRDAITEWNKLS